MKNRKKMAGTIAMIMALSLGYNAGGPVVVHAQENAVVTEKLGETAASQEGVIDFSAIKDNEDLEVADYLPSDINDMEKICTEDYSVNLVDMADNTEDNKTVNDNPNDAKAISLGTQVYDTVATELEQRWYAFSVAKATKFTAAMVMDDTADFDLYVYKLNETDGTLELVGGSAIVGAGTQELSMLKLDEGIYFIGIEAATGNGSFLMYTYAGVNDGKEINDTTDLASSYVRNSRMTATIDSPFDYDYYTLKDLEGDLVLILDHLEDPHNFGAIIRTAEAAGIDGIIIPKDRSVDVNSTVVKVSTGAIENMKSLVLGYIILTIIVMFILACIS